jgi:hypothetical protein
MSLLGPSPSTAVFLGIGAIPCPDVKVYVLIKDWIKSSKPLVFLAPCIRVIHVGPHGTNLIKPKNTFFRFLKPKTLKHPLLPNTALLSPILQFYDWFYFKNRDF